MCIIGPDRTVAAANAAAGQLLGTPPVDLIGRPLSALIAAELHTAELLAELMEPGVWESLDSHVRVSATCVTGDGRSLSIDLNLIPISESLSGLTLGGHARRPEILPAPPDPGPAAREVISGQRERRSRSATATGWAASPRRSIAERDVPCSSWTRWDRCSPMPGTRAPTGIRRTIRSAPGQTHPRRPRASRSELDGVGTPGTAAPRDDQRLRSRWRPPGVGRSARSSTRRRSWRQSSSATPPSSATGRRV